MRNGHTETAKAKMNLASERTMSPDIPPSAEIVLFLICFRNAKSLKFRLCSFNQLQRSAKRGFWKMGY